MSIVEWTPAEYVLGGVYCDLPSLRGSLSRFRRASGAESAILLVYDNEVAFRSLFLIEHREAPFGQDLEDDLLLSGSADMPTRSQLVLLADGKFHSLRSVRRDAPPLVRFANDLGWQSVWCALRFPGEEVKSPFASPLVTAVVLGFGDQQPSQLASADAVDEMHMRANATAEAGTYRYYRGSDAMDAHTAVQRLSHLDWTRRQVGHEDATTEGHPPQGFAQAILDAAIKLTGSSVGNIYLATSSYRYLDLVAWYMNDPGRRRERIRRNNPKSIVAWVNRKDRALLINDIAEFGRRHTEPRFIDVHDPSTTPPTRSLWVRSAFPDVLRPRHWRRTGLHRRPRVVHPGGR